MSELILQTMALTRRYGSTAALDGVNLSIEKGQIYGLVGRNGAGKTTLIRLISGQSFPSSGENRAFARSETQPCGSVLTPPIPAGKICSRLL